MLPIGYFGCLDMKKVQARKRKRGVEGRPLRKEKDLQNITRVDYPRPDRAGTVGWWVRIYRTVEGQRRCVNKLFSDGIWGGQYPALVRARRWRNVTLKSLPPSSGRGYRKPPGHGYVRLALRTYVPRNPTQPTKVYSAWTAWIRIEDMKARSTNWSVERWGDTGAKRRATAWLAEERKALAQRLHSKKSSPTRRLEPTSGGRTDSSTRQAVTSMAKQTRPRERGKYDSI